jgi:hypothetical protein
VTPYRYEHRLLEKEHHGFYRTAQYTPWVVDTAQFSLTTQVDCAKHTGCIGSRPETMEEEFFKRKLVITCTLRRTNEWEEIATGVPRLQSLTLLHSLCSMTHILTRVGSKYFGALGVYHYPLISRTSKMDELHHNLSKLASSARNHIPCETVKAQSFSGSSHLVCFVRFDDGVEWVARIPSKALSLQCPLPQEDIDRFASEVSTLRWLRANTSVKVPELYAWNIPDTPSLAASDVSPRPQILNTDTVPWMLMEKLTGVSLTYEMWVSFEDQQRQKVIPP